MELPDKIFITEYNASVRTGYFSHDKNDMFNQEYIRKEALLEWANKRLEEFRHIAEISNDVAADGEVDAFEELIDKINSL